MDGSSSRDQPGSTLRRVLLVDVVRYVFSYQDLRGKLAYIFDSAILNYFAAGYVLFMDMRAWTYCFNIYLHF